ncbi:UNVERIFIED_CONTAM: hypothetical protein FKN15_059104 [Acipenser sinensis]
MDLSEFEADNSRSCRLASVVPEVCRTEDCCLGIDEAGRGPVLGWMTRAACEAREEGREGRERESGAKGEGRESGEKGEVFVDTVGPAEKYQDKLSQRFPGVEVTVRPKADSLFPIVSAASICAKVARDHAVKDWTFVEDLGETEMKYGSGYPNEGLPGDANGVVRQRQADWDDDDDDEGGAKATAAKQNCPSVLSYYGRKKNDEGAKRLPHRYFTERALETVRDL